MLNANEVVAGVGYPMDAVFSDRLCLNTLTERREIQKKSQPHFQSNLNLNAKYEQILDIAYNPGADGMPGLWRNSVLSSLQSWSDVWNQATQLSHEVSNKDYNIETTDLVALQESMLKMYARGPKMATDARAQVQAMKAVEKAFEMMIGNFNDNLGFHERCWVEYAHQPPENLTDVDRIASWFGDLNKWSDLLEPLYNTIPYYEMAYERLQRLRVHLNDLPSILDTLPASFFDLYGNLLAGNQSDVDACRTDFKGFTDKIEAWASRCPTWDRVDHQRKHVSSGEVCYTRGPETELAAHPPSETFTGDYPNGVSVTNPDELQLGLSGFHFQYWSTLENSCYNRMATSLGVREGARRAWEQADRYCEMRRSNLSWITAPSKLRDKVQFSWTSLVNITGTLIASSPREPRYSAQRVSDYEASWSKATEWRVKFPRAFTSTGRIIVRPWIQEFDAQGNYYDVGFDLVVDPNTVTREDFCIRMNYPREASPIKIKIAYVAYEEGTPGFFGAQTRIEVPQSERYSGQNHNYKPEFMDLSKMNFRRRPAIMPALSGFGYTKGYDFRSDVRIAVSRVGCVIQGHSEKETVVHNLAWQVIAIANEPWY